MTTTTRRVAELAACLARVGGLSGRQAYRLRLAADEIITNILLHGYRGDGVVDLRGGVEADRVWLRIEDDAPPFDPRSYDRERVRCQVGGFGLYLATAGVDELRYEHAGGRNRNTLVIRRNGGLHGADHGVGGG